MNTLARLIITDSSSFKIHRSADARQVAESLRDIAALLARDVHFFREYPQMVRTGEGVFEVNERVITEL